MAVKKKGRKCANCKRLEARIAELEAKIAKLEKNSSNSSKPPSTDVTRPKAVAAHGKSQSNKKRKRGGQPGHPRHQRSPFPPEQIDNTWIYDYTGCPCCCGSLLDADEPDKVLQQVEIERLPFRVEEHRRQTRYCARCDKFYCPAWPEDLKKAGLVGPRWTALIGYLKSACHMSFSSIRKFLRDCVGVTISRGHLRKLFRTIHRRQEYASEASFRKSLARIRNDLVYTAIMQSPGTREADNLGDRFVDHFESFFTFITTPGVEPTNNLAEQAIRFVAIHRRLTQGTRSEAGRTWCERIWTAVTTCEQQGRSLFDYLFETVTRFFHSRPTPSLIAAPDTS